MHDSDLMMNRWMEKFEKVFQDLHNSEDGEKLEGVEKREQYRPQDIELKENDAGELYIMKRVKNTDNCFQVVRFPIIINNKEINVVRNDKGFHLVLKIRN